MRTLTAWELVYRLQELIQEHGNLEINVDLLTENQSNKFPIIDIEKLQDKDTFDITVEIEDIREFKKSIK